MDQKSTTQKFITRQPVTQTDSGIIQNKMLLSFFLLLFVAVVIKSAWLSDDAFITLRTVRNFNEGYGLVWNTHERVQAYTHPLWMLLLSLTYFVTSETYYSTLFVSIFLSAATAALIVLKVSKTLINGLLALLLLTLSKAFIDYSTSGLENPLTYLLLALFFGIFMQSEKSRHRLFWLTFVAALGMVNRLDTILFLGPALLYTLYETFDKARRWRSIPAIAMGSVPFLAWTFFSILYYGFPFPNTAYAKLSNGADSMEILKQGVFYLVDSLSVDPITLVIISLALTYSVFARNRRLILMSCGIVLYIAYVIKIGGDFMTGRFLSTPYLVAVLVVQNVNLSLKEIGTYLFIGGILFVGLFNSEQSPLFSNANYKWTDGDSNGIADERGHYYQIYGLMSADRQSLLVEQGIVRGTDTPLDFIHCGIGLRGFSASPYTRLIDYCGLADAFMARLPTRYEPKWRAGHPIRQVPVGYLGTLRTGINQISDPNMALFYDNLTKITQGKLFDRERFAEIWRFNTGAYDHLLDPEKLRFPHIVELSLDDKPGSEFGESSIIFDELFFTNNADIEMNPQGVRIDLGQKWHPTHLDVGINSFYFDVVYFLDGVEVGRQTINQWPLMLEERHYSVITVPPFVAETGIDMIRISPRVNLSRHRFTYITLLNLNALNKPVASEDMSSTELRELLQLYYHIFYRQNGLERERLLDHIMIRLQDIAPEHWSNVSSALFYELLPMPAPSLHKVILPYLKTDVLFTDASGHPQVRYIGSLEPEQITLDGQSALKFNLYFLVEEAIGKNYTLWFGVRKKKVDGEEFAPNEYDEWIIWDDLPEPPTQRWGPGMVLNLTPEIKIKPAEYEFSFGFGTLKKREKLFIEHPDIDSIDLGSQMVK